MDKKYKELLRKVGVGASKAILLSLFIGGAAISYGGLVPAVRSISELFEGKALRDFDREQIARAIKYLKSRKLIEVQRTYNQEAFKLTKLGRRKVRKLMKSFGVIKPKKWDGKWRIVIFDVPETKKDERDIFRAQLKSLGLAHLQKSIFVHPYECRDQVYYLARNLYIQPSVRYIIAEEITGEKDLRRRFDL